MKDCNGELIIPRSINEVTHGSAKRLHCSSIDSGMVEHNAHNSSTRRRFQGNGAGQFRTFDGEHSQETRRRFLPQLRNVVEADGSMVAWAPRPCRLSEDDLEVNHNTELFRNLATPT
jgi:hypothetical protein